MFTDEALILESQVLALSSPSSQVTKDFKRWLTRDSLPVLWGHDEHLFDDERDLVALASVDTDRLNRLLMRYSGWFFRVCEVRHEQPWAIVAIG